MIDVCSSHQRAIARKILNEVGASKYIINLKNGECQLIVNSDSPLTNPVILRFKTKKQAIKWLKKRR